MINNPHYIHNYTAQKRLPFTLQKKHKGLKEKQKDELKLPSSFLVVL